jgi:hypothetical protein
VHLAESHAWLFVLCAPFFAAGGERKRVSVGHELLINPAILLLDEPTSGLDSSAARKMVELLRELASSGRVVITTIHQPSSNIYQKLDTVLLLSQVREQSVAGHVALRCWPGQGGVLWRCTAATASLAVAAFCSGGAGPVIGVGWLVV